MRRPLQPPVLFNALNDEVVFSFGTFDFFNSLGIVLTFSEMKKKKKNAESKPALLLNVGGVSDVIQEKFWFWPRWPHNQRCQQQRSSSPSNKQTRKIFFFGQALKIINFTKYFTSEDLQRWALMNSSSLVLFLERMNFCERIDFKWKRRRHDFKNHFSFIFGANLLMAQGL